LVKQQGRRRRRRRRRRVQWLVVGGFALVGCFLTSIVTSGLGLVNMPTIPTPYASRSAYWTIMIVVDLSGSIN
jgi:hypothetical protein